MLGKIFNFDALLFTTIGGLLTYRFFSRGGGQPTVQLIVPAVAVLVAIIFWLGLSWARWLAAAACLLFGASTFYVMRIDGFTKLGLAVLAACAWGMYTYAFEQDAPEPPVAQDEDTGVDEGTSAASSPTKTDDRECPCLVLLLPAALAKERLTVPLLRAAIEQQLGLHLEIGGNSTEFVTGTWPMFMAQFGGNIWHVHEASRPYFEDSESVASGINELRLARVVRNHRAFLGFSLVFSYEGTAPAEPYRTLGKLVVGVADALRAEKTGDQPELGVLWEAGRQVRILDDDSRSRLTSDDPLSTFREFHSSQPPVLRADDDDPRLVAAVEEARRRWPEFVKAFQQRQPHERYAVKVAVREEDRKEYLWLLVEGLEGDQIHGRLDNAPVALTQIRMGAAMTVAAAELTDWLFTGTGAHQGGFTLAPLAEIQRGAKQA